MEIAVLRPPPILNTDFSAGSIDILNPFTDDVVHQWFVCEEIVREIFLYIFIFFSVV